MMHASYTMMYATKLLSKYLFRGKKLKQGLIFVDEIEELHS